jgi:hypothetical protein
MIATLPSKNIWTVLPRPPHGMIRVKDHKVEKTCREESEGLAGPASCDGCRNLFCHCSRTLVKGDFSANFSPV